MVLHINGRLMLCSSHYKNPGDRGSRTKWIKKKKKNKQRYMEPRHISICSKKKMLQKDAAEQC